MGEKGLKPSERMKRIDFDKNHIIGKSGKKYYIGNTLTVGRYQMYEDLEIKVLLWKAVHPMVVTLPKVWVLTLVSPILIP